MRSDALGRSKNDVIRPERCRHAPLVRCPVAPEAITEMTVVLVLYAFADFTDMSKRYYNLW